jgi:predicted Co/Zn/Cd cation transporter (cation efflux family)
MEIIPFIILDNLLAQESKIIVMIHFFYSVEMNSTKDVFYVLYLLPYILNSCNWFLIPRTVKNLNPKLPVNKLLG